MRLKVSLIALALAVIATAQDSAGPGFIIALKNGSSIRGRALARDAESGKLRLTMTETAGGEPKSYAVVFMDDVEAIRASSADSDSITIKLRGGSQLRCKEFTLGGQKITVKVGSASRVEVTWEEIESISFGP
jgi:hypothetical protein